MVGFRRFTIIQCAGQYFQRTLIRRRTTHLGANEIIFLTVVLKSIRTPPIFFATIFFREKNEGTDQILVCAYIFPREKYGGQLS